MAQAERPPGEQHNKPFKLVLAFADRWLLESLLLRTYPTSMASNIIFKPVLRKLLELETRKIAQIYDIENDSDFFEYQ